MKTIVERQREFFRLGNTHSYEFRIHQLKILSKALKKYQGEFLKALAKDLDKSEKEAYFSEIATLQYEIKHTIKHLKEWMHPKKVRTPVRMFPGKSKIYYEPKGVVLVISPWNYPLYLAVAPLIGSIASGNCTIIKPSEITKETSAVLEEMMLKNFNPEYIACVPGDKDVVTNLLGEKLDHIFFTGGAKVGRIIMETAGRQLTPVTLELGGKSPCIIEKHADLKNAAFWITLGKYINAGQTCVAPDYVLIEKDAKKAFVRELKKMAEKLSKYYPVDKPEKGSSLSNIRMGRIVNEKHFHRLIDLMNSGRILIGGNQDAIHKKIEFTVLDQVKVESPVMNEEIFGPILPIITWKNRSELYKVLEHFEKPLACYVFTRDKRFYEELIHRFSFGGGCLNSVLIHLLNSNLGFGGVGGSGIGNYHGYHGFLELSHEKSVVERFN